MSDDAHGMESLDSPSTVIAGDLTHAMPALMLPPRAQNCKKIYRRPVGITLGFHRCYALSAIGLIIVAPVLHMMMHMAKFLLSFPLTGVVFAGFFAQLVDGSLSAASTNTAAPHSPPPRLTLWTALASQWDGLRHHLGDGAHLVRRPVAHDGLLGGAPRAARHDCALGRRALSLRQRG